MGGCGPATLLEEEEVESALVRRAGQARACFSRGVCSVEEVAPGEEPGGSRKPISLHCDSTAVIPVGGMSHAPMAVLSTSSSSTTGTCLSPVLTSARHSAGSSSGVGPTAGLDERETQGQLYQRPSRVPWCRGGWEEAAEAVTVPGELPCSGKPLGTSCAIIGGEKLPFLPEL